MEKATVFNNYFANATNVVDEGHALPVFHPLTDKKLDYIHILQQDVLDQLVMIDTTKSYGPDEISPKFLKEGKDLLYEPLCTLFNLSLQHSKFPSSWKVANTMPIHKKDDRDICGNYRPVSLLSAMSKIFERIVFKYVFNHFQEKFLISVWQSGFLPGSSTITQLIEVYHKFCEAVYHGKEVRVVFLDITKAFNPLRPTP